MKHPLQRCGNADRIDRGQAFKRPWSDIDPPGEFLYD